MSAARSLALPTTDARPLPSGAGHVYLQLAHVQPLGKAHALAR